MGNQTKIKLKKTKTPHKITHAHVEHVTVAYIPIMTHDHSMKIPELHYPIIQFFKLSIFFF